QVGPVHNFFTLLALPASLLTFWSDTAFAASQGNLTRVTQYPDDHIANLKVADILVLSRDQSPQNTQRALIASNVRP
ncbi:hypothetical protein, partial [Sansalvadorimonas verongulae]|uniref:hypothetical protein n=1 Tax=Sansalvadorimonas verongulae TaxID=2172824 RepID=UPI001E55826C